MAIAKSRYGLVAAVCAAVVVADRVTKELARAFLSADGGDQAVRVVKGVLYLRWSTNSAGFFGFLDVIPEWARPAVFVIATVLFCVFVLVLIRRAPPASGERMGLSLVLAGFLGNGIDRALYGHVIDCLFVRVSDAWRAAVNLADLAIFVGIVWVALQAVASARRTPRTIEPLA